MSRPKTDISERLAEDIVSVIDYLSRVLQGAEEGQQHYLWEKSFHLARVARRLHGTLSELPLPEDASASGEPDHSVRFNPARVQKLVERGAQHYRAGRALYPRPARDTAAAVAELDRIIGGGQ